MVNSINLDASQKKAQYLIKKAQSGNNKAIEQLCISIFDATAGRLGTNESLLNTVISSSDNTTLAKIMDNYTDITGSEIYKDIQNDFSGDNEDIIISTFDNAYKEVNRKEYTGDNDGKLNNHQITKGIGKGLFKKLPSIGLIAAGAALAPTIAGAAGTALATVFGATAAATIATVAAPVLAAVGIATAGYMIYKGVTQTKEAIGQGQKATTDDLAQNAVTLATEGTVDIVEGLYLGSQSVKGLYESINTKAGSQSKLVEEPTQKVTNVEETVPRTTKTQTSKGIESPAQINSAAGTEKARVISKASTSTNTKELPEGAPEYLYHMTPTENYKQIIKSGQIKTSDIETGANGCNGVYMVSKENLATKWMGRREPELFGDVDLGEMLMTWTGAGTENMTAIKIPTSSLDLSKLKFRPYVETCKQGIQSLDDNLIANSEMVTKGLELNELPKYIGNEAVEFVYQGEIQSSLFTGAESSPGNLPFADIIKNLFN